jgi:hypothetical protein
MRNLLAGVGVILTVTCETMTPTPASAQPGPPCGGTNHCDDVTIACGAIQSVANVVVSGNTHQIYWRIKTSGYSFASPPQPIGIAFKPPSPINDNGRMPPNEFPCNRISATLFHCTDANSTHGAGVRSYQYSITVIDTSGKPIVSDPWVVNH